MIVGGDFNQMPWSAATTRIARASNTRPIDGIRATFVKKNGLVRLPIDHVLVPPGWNARAFLQQVGMHTLAPHPLTEASIVELAAVKLPHPVQHLAGAVGDMGTKPLLEQRSNFQRQAQGNHAGSDSTRVGGGAQDRLDLVIGQTGNHRADHDADLDTGIRQPFDRLQSARRDRHPRLQSTGQRVVQRRNRQADAAKLRPHLGQDIRVAFDHHALGGDADRMGVIAQDA